MSELFVQAASAVISKAILVGLFPNVFSFSGLKEILLRIILVHIIKKYYGYGHSIVGLAFMLKKGEVQGKRVIMNLLKDLTRVRYGLWIVVELLMESDVGGINRFCEKSLAALVGQEIRTAILNLQLWAFLLT